MSDMSERIRGLLWWLFVFFLVWHFRFWLGHAMIGTSFGIYAGYGLGTNPQVSSLVGWFLYWVVYRMLYEWNRIVFGGFVLLTGVASMILFILLGDDMIAYSKIR